MRFTTFDVSFYCRESKINRKGTAPIEMGITLNGERKYLNLPRKEEPETFKKAMKAMRNNEIKRFCSLMEEKVKKAMNDIMEQGEELKLDTIKTYLQSGGIKSYTIENLFNDYLNIKEKNKNNGEITGNAYRKYVLTKELFFKHSTLKPTDEVNRINYAVIEDFYAELKGKYESASSASYMRKLKSVIEFGRKNNKIALDPFNNIKIVVEKKEIQYLTEWEIEELKKLRKENILGDSLQNVLNCFLLQINTGLAYTDLESLEREDIQREGESYVISKKRKKSGVKFTAFLLPDGEEMLREFGIIQNYTSSDALDDSSNDLIINGLGIRVISNQKMNVYLHQIENVLRARNGRWNKSLHTHLGRHTYAYLLLNKYRIRAESAAKMMGHTTSKTTLKFYAEITDNTVIEEMKEAIERMK